MVRHHSQAWLLKLWIGMHVFGMQGCMRQSPQHIHRHRCFTWVLLLLLPLLVAAAAAALLLVQLLMVVSTDPVDHLLICPAGVSAAVPVEQQGCTQQHCQLATWPLLATPCSL